MEKLLKQINKLTNLNDDEISGLKNITKSKSYKKGETILKLNKINKKLYFINNGLIKVSFFKERKEFVMKFFHEHEFCAVLDSLTTNEPSNYSIKALTDVSLLEIDFLLLNKLAAEHQPFEKLISEITSMATRKMMSRIRELLETDAKERYLNFLENNNHLMKIVSLKDLSAYLGISQVSLSRIRAKI